jgi:hypothetical protein
LAHACLAPEGAWPGDLKNKYSTHTCENSLQFFGVPVGCNPPANDVRHYTESQLWEHQVFLSLSLSLTLALSLTLSLPCRHVLDREFIDNCSAQHCLLMMIHTHSPHVQDVLYTRARTPRYESQTLLTRRSCSLFFFSTPSVFWPDYWL